MDIYLNEELLTELDKNGVDIKDLVSSIEDVDIRYGASIENPNEDRSKSIVPIILASSVALIAVSYSIARILKTIYGRPRLVQIIEETPVVDRDGNISRDSTGNPRMKKKIIHQITEPENYKSEENIELEFSLTEGAKVKIESKDL
jgi:hypothetical protein